MINTNRTQVARLVAGAALVAGVVGGVGSPASADKPTVTTDSVTFVAENPCTGAEHEITIDFELREHTHGERSIVHVARTGTTSDGYTMKNGVSTEVFNGNVFRAALTDNWKSDDGSKFQARGVFVAKEDGIVVDKFDLRCLGG